MAKTPSQKKSRRRQRSLTLKDENNEPTRKRLSRRRNRLKPASSKQVSQSLQGKGGVEKPIQKGVNASFSTARFHSKVEAKCSPPSEAVAKTPTIPLVEGRVPLTEISVDHHSGADLYLNRNRPEIIDQALESISLSTDDQAPKKPKVTELQPMSAALALVIPDSPEAKETGEDRDAANFRIANTSTPEAAVNGEPGAESVSAQGPEKELFQDLKDRTGTSPGSKSRYLSARRSQRAESHKHRRISLAEKYSLASKRERMIRKSISRALSKKKAARESSSASSYVSCYSAREQFRAEEPSSNVRPELEPNAAYDKAPKHLQKTFIVPNEGSPVAGQSAQSEPPNGTEQQAGNCKESHLKKSGTSQSSGSKEQPQNAKPLELPSSIRRQSYKQAAGERCNGQQLEDCDHSPSYDKATSSPEKERQRLESLRKKQQAKQQRKQKVEEEKRPCLTKMTLRSETRRRKALQARERVEGMEEKLTESKEKTEKVREEKVVEEQRRRRKKKVAQTTVSGVLTRKQKALQMEEDERKQRELVHQRTEEETHTSAPQEQAKERRHKQQEKGKALHLQMEPAAATEEEENQKKKSPVTDSHQGPPFGSKEPGFPKVNPNYYGLDLSSDDSTDDESRPRKPIPVWATGAELRQAVTYQYYNPANTETIFGVCQPPNLEDIFRKKKRRYFTRTSSALWHSPPLPGTKSTRDLPYNLRRKY